MAKKPASETQRYAAKLLFQFRVGVDGDSGKRRLCEERIVVLEARTAKDALAKAKRKGKRGEHSHENDEGNTVHFEFIGVLELIHLGVECEDDEGHCEDWLKDMLIAAEITAIRPKEASHG